MREFKALVLAHYDFTDKQNKHVQKTKLIVSLGDYGTTEVCIPLDKSLDLLTEIKVKLGYKNNKFIVDSIVK